MYAEAEMLSAAERVFTPEDWQAINQAFEADRDPLAGGERDPTYDRLFTRIVLATPAPLGVGAALTGTPA